MQGLKPEGCSPREPRNARRSPFCPEATKISLEGSPLPQAPRAACQGRGSATGGGGHSCASKLGCGRRGSLCSASGSPNRGVRLSRGALDRRVRGDEASPLLRVESSLVERRSNPHPVHI